MPSPTDLETDASDRTNYLRVGGVMVLAATAAAACSFGPPERTQTEATPVTTVPGPSDGDKANLEFAAKLAGTVSHLYEGWAAAPFVAGQSHVVDLLGALGTNHTAHLGAVNTLLVRNGRKEIKAAVDPATKSKLAPTDPTTVAQVLQTVATIEDTLAQTYLSLVGSGTQARLDLDYVAIAGANARHAVAARRTLNPDDDPVTASQYPVTKALKP